MQSENRLCRLRFKTFVFFLLTFESEHDLEIKMRYTTLNAESLAFELGIQQVVNS